MSATCAVTRCQCRVQPGKLMCRDHWFAVPKPIRTRIWRTYRAAQEASQFHARIDQAHLRSRIAAYRDAVREAVEHLDTQYRDIFSNTPAKTPLQASQADGSGHPTPKDGPSARNPFVRVPFGGYAQ